MKIALVLCLFCGLLWNVQIANSMSWVSRENSIYEYSVSTRKNRCVLAQFFGCRRNGGNLVTVETQDDKDYLKSILPLSVPYQWIIIGLFRFTPDFPSPLYDWRNYEVPGFPDFPDEDWVSGKAPPDPERGSCYCGTLNLVSLKWRLVPCLNDSHHYYYVCEREAEGNPVGESPPTDGEYLLETWIQRPNHPFQYWVSEEKEECSGYICAGVKVYLATGKTAEDRAFIASIVPPEYEEVTTGLQIHGPTYPEPEFTWRDPLSSPPVLRPEDFIDGVIPDAVIPAECLCGTMRRDDGLFDFIPCSAVDRKYRTHYVCQRTIDCSKFICENGGTCSLTDEDVPTCTCAPGYKGMRCQDDIDECILFDYPCPEEQACENTPGSFQCYHCPEDTRRVAPLPICIPVIEISPDNPWGIDSFPTISFD